MSLLSRKIVAEVDAGPGPGPLSVADGPYQLTLHLTAASTVGIAFDALDFAETGKPDRSTDALKAWGDRLAARLTYLMEPLIVLEVDALGGEVELRSQAPSARDTLRTYYEVHLRREGTLRLRRVAFDTATRRRTTVPCQLTREALERLTDDLVASVA
jgi:hypothetical protein